VLYGPRDVDRPLVVFLHGGIWILGDLETHDRFCRRLAAKASAHVLAVDYRRAPEHRCEAGLPHGFIQGMELESAAAARASERLFADVARLLTGPAQRSQ
jgi:alpha/beta hydrolase family protein